MMLKRWKGLATLAIATTIGFATGCNQADPKRDREVEGKRANNATGEGSVGTRQETGVPGSPGADCDN